VTIEEWHAFIAAHLPEPVRVEEGAGDDIWFTGGDPGQVIVRLRPRSIAVYEYTVRAETGPPAVFPRLVGSLRPRGVDDSRAMSIVQSLIDAARERRAGRFRVCRVCGERRPPEWMAQEVCEDCAEGRLDVVH
jgi:hypothetical protein